MQQAQQHSIASTASHAAYGAQLLLLQITPALQLNKNKFKKKIKKIHHQHLNIPIWAFSKKSISVSISYCLPLARAETNLPPATALSLAGNPGLKLCGEPGARRGLGKHAKYRLYLCIDESASHTRFFCGLHILPQQMFRAGGIS